MNLTSKVVLFSLLSSFSIKAFSLDTSGGACTQTNADNKPGSAAQSAAQIVQQYPGGDSMMNAAKKFDSSAKECTGKSSGAQDYCIEACNDSLQEAKLQSQIEGSKVNSGESRDTSKYKGASDRTLAEGFRNFLVQCGPAKQQCETTCDQALKDLDALGAAANSVNCAGVPQAQQPACQMAKNQAVQRVQQIVNAEKNAGNILALQGKSSECKGKFSSNMGDASKMLAGLLAALAQAMQSQGQSNSTDPTVTPEKTLDCNVEPDKSTKQCICLNPRMPGCAEDGTAQTASFGGDGTTFGANPNANGNVNLPPAPPQAPQITNAAAGRDGGSLSAAGAGGGGGLMGGGGSNSSGGGKENTEKAKASSLSANIFSGDGGGGGGGSSAGPGYSDYGSGSTKRKPTSVLATSKLAAASASGPFTGSAGRTNWQKVKIRYGDNMGSFLRDEKAFFSSAKSAQSP